MGQASESLKTADGEIEIVQPSSQERAAWPKRADGSQKGLGFFGLMKRPDGYISSELSIGVNLGRGETEIPLLVPTLTRSEINHLLSGEKPTEGIVRKAVDHATLRMQSGKNPFAEEGEQVPLPTDPRSNASKDLRAPYGY